MKDVVTLCTIDDAMKLTQDVNDLQRISLWFNSTHKKPLSFHSSMFWTVRHTHTHTHMRRVCFVYPKFQKVQFFSG